MSSSCRRLATSHPRSLPSCESVSAMSSSTWRSAPPGGPPLIGRRGGRRRGRSRRRRDTAPARRHVEGRDEGPARAGDHVPSVLLADGAITGWRRQRRSRALHRCSAPLVTPLADCRPLVAPKASATAVPVDSDVLPQGGVPGMGPDPHVCVRDLLPDRPATNASRARGRMRTPRRGSASLPVIRASPHSRQHGGRATTCFFARTRRPTYPQDSPPGRSRRPSADRRPSG